MVSQVLLYFEGHAAYLTHVILLIFVGINMLFQQLPAVERFSADFANMVPNIMVSLRVLLVWRHLSEASVANGTCVWFYATVCDQVLLEVDFRLQ